MRLFSQLVLILLVMVTGTIGYGYDAAGNLAGAKSATPGGYDVSYDYDSLNRITMVHRGQEGIDPAATELAAYNYDANGNLNGSGYANGVQHAYTYYALNRLTSLGVNRVNLLASASSPVALQGYSYQLNNNGHRTQIAELSGRTLTNTFDALHRLTKETITQGGLGVPPHTITPAGTLAYSYDAVGNRQSRSSSGNSALTGILPSQSQSFTANDRLTSDTYDANGNTTQSVPAGSSTVTDVYSFDNKLIRRTVTGGKTINITYNPDGHRLTKLVSQGGLTQRLHHYLTDANNPTGYGQVIEERDPLAAVGSELKKVHLYGHDLISSETSSTPHSALRIPHFYQYDGLGSVRGISNENGDLEETYDYDAYGTLIGLAKRNTTSGDLESSDLSNSAHKPTSEFLFTGEQWDGDIGMYFLRARYLNTSTGRFHTQDNYEGRNGEPLSLHKYLYVHGNPVGNVDPSGNIAIAMEFTLALSLSANLTGLDAARVNGFAVAVSKPLVVGLGTAAIGGTALYSYLKNSKALANVREVAKLDILRRTQGRDIIFHYTDKISAAAIFATRCILATPKKRAFGMVYPAGAYATDITPYNVSFKQSDLKNIFYGGDQSKDFSWFVAIEKADFIPAPVGAHQFYRPAPVGGFLVNVTPLMFGPSLLDP